jgi:metal-responsive CopG/Arc/MetJ family transcriptional regulator
MKSKSLHISFPRSFMQLLDKWAKITKRNRSEFVREAVRHYIVYLKGKETIL